MYDWGQREIYHPRKRSRGTAYRDTGSTIYKHTTAFDKMQHKTGTRPAMGCVPVFVFWGGFGGAEGKAVRTRRRSRPWLPLWGSWRASGEPERAQAVAIWENAEIAAGYPLSHDTFSIFATAYTLSVTAFSRASSPKGRAKGRASPARRSEITMWVNWWRSRLPQRASQCEPGGASKFPFGDLVATPTNASK